MPGVRVVRVAGHRDVTTGSIFGEGRIKFTPIKQPGFQIDHGAALPRAGFETVEMRHDLRPVAGIQFRWQEPA